MPGCGLVRTFPMFLLSKMENVQEWQNVQKGLVEGGHAHHASITRWIRPARGALKCNVDGTIFGVAELVSVGCISRKKDEALCQATFRTIPGCSPSESEAMALCVALTRIRELSLYNVILELDCKATVNAFHSSLLNYSEFGCLVSRCRSLASLIENVSIIFVKRQANMVAHTLTRAACSFASSSFWLEAPPFLMDALVADLHG